MYGFSALSSLQERAADLRNAAANEAAARAARSQVRLAAREAAEAAAKRREQSAAFSWESHRLARSSNY